MTSVQSDLINHHCSSSTQYVQAASTPLDTLATKWLVRGSKEVSSQISTDSKQALPRSELQEQLSAQHYDKKQ